MISVNTLNILIRFLSRKDNYEIFYGSELDAKKHFFGFKVEFKWVSEEWEYEMPELIEIGLEKLNKNKKIIAWMESIADPRNRLFTSQDKFDNFIDNINSIIRKDGYELNNDNQIIKHSFVNDSKENWKGALWALADELREHKKNGKFDTYRECYDYGVKKYLHKDKPIKSKSLENEFHKARAKGIVEL